MGFGFECWVFSLSVGFWVSVGSLGLWLWLGLGLGFGVGIWDLAFGVCLGLVFWSGFGSGIVFLVW